MGPKACASVVVFAFFAGFASAGAAWADTIDPTLAPGGDPAHGEQLFKQRCLTCHTQPDPGAKSGIGPALYGAYGRTAGKAPGFTYSAGLKAATFAWTPEKLNQWIQKPASLIPGVKMFLPPVTAPKDRADIIAYLKSHSTNTAAPEPAPAAKSKKKASPHKA
jgi:cytochrome c